MLFISILLITLGILCFVGILNVYTLNQMVDKDNLLKMEHIGIEQAVIDNNLPLKDGRFIIKNGQILEIVLAVTGGILTALAIITVQHIRRNYKEERSDRN